MDAVVRTWRRLVMWEWSKYWLSISGCGSLAVAVAPTDMDSDGAREVVAAEASSTAEGVVVVAWDAALFEDALVDDVM